MFHLLTPLVSENYKALNMRGNLFPLMKESNSQSTIEKIVPIAVKLDPDMQRDQIMALAELFLELK